MTILIDSKGHMVSTTSVQELHIFAISIGLRPEWYQAPRRAFKNGHYDLTAQNKVNRALLDGAHPVSTRNLIKRAWWSRLISK